MYALTNFILNHGRSRQKIQKAIQSHVHFVLVLIKTTYPLEHVDLKIHFSLINQGCLLLFYIIQMLYIGQLVKKGSNWPTINMFRALPK